MRPTRNFTRSWMRTSVVRGRALANVRTSSTVTTVGPSSVRRLRRLERLAGHRALRRARLVEAAHRRRVGGVARDLRVLGRLAEDLGERVDEAVERLAGLGLGRLDEQRLVDDQREVDGRRVDAVVEQALGQVD